MVLKRANILVSGEVQMAGFRSFVKKLADSLDIKGYVENLPDRKVNIVSEGEEESIEELVNSVKTKAPALSKVEDVLTKYEEYVGEFLEFERRGEDIPKKATLDDLLNVMKSFDRKAEKIVVVLGEIKEDTAQIPKIVENTEKILEHTSQIPKIVENTSQIPALREDVAEMKQHTSLIPAMKEDTAAIRTDTREITSKLWEKYEEMSREIAQMKVTLARIEAKVFS